jgi:hypothetical protein
MELRACRWDRKLGWSSRQALFGCIASGGKL